MFLQPDWTLVIQLVNFAIFFAILNAVFLRPVSRAIRERRAYINSVTSDYETAQGEAAKLRAAAEALRTDARRDAADQIARDRADASNESAEIAQRYALEAQATVEQAHATVAKEVAAARLSEERLVESLSDVVLERTIAEARA